jgi:hypothetical protein
VVGGWYGLAGRSERSLSVLGQQTSERTGQVSSYESVRCENITMPLCNLGVRGWTNMARCCDSGEKDSGRYPNLTKQGPVPEKKTPHFK